MRRPAVRFGNAPELPAEEKPLPPLNKPKERPGVIRRLLASKPLGGAAALLAVLSMFGGSSIVKGLRNDPVQQGWERMVRQLRLPAYNLYIIKEALADSRHRENVSTEVEKVAVREMLQDYFRIVYANVDQAIQPARALNDTLTRLPVDEVTLEKTIAFFDKAMKADDLLDPPALLKRYVNEQLAPMMPQPELDSLRATLDLFLDRYDASEAKINRVNSTRTTIAMLAVFALIGHIFANMSMPRPERKPEENEPFY